MVVRRVWGSKTELLAGGVVVEALAYQRASADKKQQGKSVGDQATLNRRDVTAQGWRLGASYTDKDRSASRHAKKSRPDYKRLLDDIAAGRGDVLVLWEIARGQRDLAVYVEIRDLCVRVGLRSVVWDAPPCWCIARDRRRADDRDRAAGNPPRGAGFDPEAIKIGWRH